MFIINSCVRNGDVRFVLTKTAALRAPKNLQGRVKNKAVIFVRYHTNDAIESIFPDIFMNMLLFKRFNVNNHQRRVKS
jgi:hypothetical protein